MYSTIRLSRLYEQIVEQIQDRIVDGRLSPGDKLPAERELGEQFGVSRTAVREAIKALQEKGLVEILPGRGTFVTEISNALTDNVRESLSLVMGTDLVAGLRDLNQVRMILEPEIAAIASLNGSKEDFEAMAQAIDIMDETLDDARRFVEADLDFHLALAKATQNTLIPILIDPVIDLLREQRMRMSQKRSNAERGQFHHKRILSAVVRRDYVAAREAMSAHLRQVIEDSMAMDRITQAEQES